MRVTLADGTTQTVKGTATIQVGSSGGTTSIATGQGLDLPAGTYNVATSYTHPVTSEKLTSYESITLQ